MSYHNENCATLHNSIDECDCDKGKIESLRAKVKELTAIINSLTDPNVVLANMLRGHIGFPHHLKVAEDRVHELEQKVQSHEQRAIEAVFEFEKMATRIKELEEAMPDAGFLRVLACAASKTVEGWSVKLDAMADRIEKVMRRE